MIWDFLIFVNKLTKKFKLFFNFIYLFKAFLITVNALNLSYISSITTVFFLNLYNEIKNVLFLQRETGTSSIF